MKKVAFTLFLAFAIMSCGIGKTEEQAGKWKNFFSEWNKDNKEIDEYFILDFRSNADTLVEISYSVMGPFEEFLSGKLISDTQAELYFDYIVGSISFDRITEKEEATLKECRKKKVADCIINPDGTMTLQTYHDKCGQLPPNTKIILRKTTDVTDMGKSEYEEEDPFSEVVAQYSPEQLKKLLGKTEPTDVRDLFILLPDELCVKYANTTQADRQAMAKGKFKGETNRMWIDEIDLAHGYLDLDGIVMGFEGGWEMFAKKIDGVWWIAVNEQNCAAMCFTLHANTYTFKNGTLTRHTEANLAGYQDVWAELFIDFDQLTEKQKEQVNKIWENHGIEDVLFKLPRDGKTITMYVDKLPYLEAEIPETALKKVKKEIWK